MSDSLPGTKTDTKHPEAAQTLVRIIEEAVRPRDTMIAALNRDLEWWQKLAMGQRRVIWILGALAAGLAALAAGLAIVLIGR